MKFVTVYTCLFGFILFNLCMHIKDIFVEWLGRQISTLYHERISPEVIFLHPPEKLVIEVRCRGKYNGISWDRPSGSIDRSLLSNHDEIYALGRTTEADYGLYQVVLLPSPPIFQDIVPTSILDFIVIAPGLSFDNLYIVCYASI